MIGSHNSLTYNKPKCFFMKAFSWIWRCQSMTLKEQLNKVDYFDIRVRYNKKGNLVFCHGLVDMKTDYTLGNVLSLLHKNNKKCRVILERGKDQGLNSCLETWVRKGVVESIIIKKGWRILYNKTSRPCKDYTYIPFYSDKPWWKQLKHLHISTPRKWAEKHNPEITDEITKDSVIHFMDFVK